MPDTGKPVYHEPEHGEEDQRCQPCPCVEDPLPATPHDRITQASRQRRVVEERNERFAYDQSFLSNQSDNSRCCHDIMNANDISGCAANGL